METGRRFWALLVRAQSPPSSRRVLVRTCFDFPRSTSPTPRSQSSSWSRLPGTLPRRPLSCSTAPSRRGRITPPAGTTQTGPPRSAAAMGHLLARSGTSDAPGPLTATGGVCYQRGFLFTRAVPCVLPESDVADATGVERSAAWRRPARLDCTVRAGARVSKRKSLFAEATVVVSTSR
ncbi:hypothetical protein MTO96_012560 [Rhipicephalus appendiculatus]